MKPGIRKTMRVATAFTGVAAGLTVGAQAAHASTRYGNIKETPACGAFHSHPQWFHYAGNSGASYCYGFKGNALSPPGHGLKAECGGTNWGWASGHLQSGNHWSLTYGPGHTYRTTNLYSFYNIVISAWDGSSTCPTY